MTPTLTMALVNIGIAVAIAGLSVPLILRKVPMNHLYGVRFPQSFASKEAWYEINEYGGKALFISAIPMFLFGLYGVVQQPEKYSVIGSAILIISVMMAFLMSYLKARNVANRKS